MDANERFQWLFKKFRIHPIFWMVLGAGILTGHFWEVLTVLFIVLVHECGHTFMALHYGWRLESVEILPFGGIARVNEHGTRPMKEEWWVILAGPIQHLWLPIVSYLLLGCSFWNEQNHEIFLQRNGMILMFNLLPIWPLDGGKILLLLLSLKLPYQKAYRLALLLSALFLLIITGWIVWHTTFLLNYSIVALFLVISILKEWRAQPYVFMRFLLERWHASGDDKRSRTRKIIVTPETSALKIFAEFRRGVKHCILIKGRGWKREIDEKTLLEAFFSGKLTDKSIGEVFT